MALRANFMVLEGRAWTALAHTDAVLRRWHGSFLLVLGVAVPGRAAV